MSDEVAKDDLAAAIDTLSAKGAFAVKHCKKCHGLRRTPEGVRCGACGGSGMERKADGPAATTDRVDMKK